jgi:hypothetical protein
MAEGFEDYLQRIGAPLPRFAFGEACVAGMAEPALENLMLFVTLPSSRDVSAVAIDAMLKISADQGSLVVRGVPLGFGCSV